MSGLEGFAQLVDGDHGLCVVSTLRPDGTIQSSVVNAGVLPHPVTGEQVVGLVSRGDAHRLANLRVRPRATVVIRAGWQWSAVEGPVELAGPDDPLPGVDAERLRLLLREIFTAAGGTHDDFDAYDRVMADERTGRGAGDPGQDLRQPARLRRHLPVMETERRSITRPDGRKIDFLVAGPPDGLPLVLHEGTPVGLVLYPPTVQVARVRGLRVILAARPGYEGSTPRPGRRVVDVAQDTAAVLDELGADAFVTVGWSGGGPHALACAAALPGRCLAAASIAGVAPYRANGLDWLAGMGPENVAEFGAATRGEAALTAFLDHEAVMLSTLTGESVAKALGGLVIEADRAVLTGEFADYVAAGLRAATNSGIAGRRDDDLAFVNDWGFSLGWDSPDGEPGQPPELAGPELRRHQS